MNRKDFEAVSRVIATLPAAVQLPVAMAFVAELQGSHSGFDGPRFLVACKIKTPPMEAPK